MNQTNKKPTKTTSKTATPLSQKTNEKSLVIPNTIIKLTIPKLDAQKAYQKALKKLAKTIKLDGFRKGNVPAKIAEESLNPQQIIENALQLVVPEIYLNEIKKSGKTPITYPEFNPISLKKGEDWIIEAHIAEQPKINLKSYKSIVKKAQKQAIKEIEKAIATEKKSKKDDKNNLKTPTNEEKKNLTLQIIYRELITEIKPEIQELLVKEEVRFDLEDLSHRLKHMNITFEKFLEHRKMNFEQLSNELAIVALGRIQMTFLINEIAKEEKITVEKKDINAELEKVEDKILREKQKNDPKYIDWMNHKILRQKVADYVLTIK